jgi:hypothetical protein
VLDVNKKAANVRVNTIVKTSKKEVSRKREETKNSLGKKRSPLPVVCPKQLSVSADTKRHATRQNYKQID